MKINRIDKNGIQLLEGDIVAECQVGAVIWDGQAIVKRRPLGIVVVHSYPNVMAEIEPEETDFYNIIPIRVGLVELSEKADKWMTGRRNDNMIELYLSRYDGDFCGWGNIERIGSIYDIQD